MSSALSDCLRVHYFPYLAPCVDGWHDAWDVFRILVTRPRSVVWDEAGFYWIWDSTDGWLCCSLLNDPVGADDAESVTE